MLPVYSHTDTFITKGNSIGDRGLAALSEAILQTHSLEELGLGRKRFCCSFFGIAISQP